MQSANGANGAHNSMVPAALPQAGQQADLNILYNLVHQLSEELASNRQQVASLIGNVNRLQNLRLADRDGSDEDHWATGTAVLAPTDLPRHSKSALKDILDQKTALEEDNARLKRENAILDESCNKYYNLVERHDKNLFDIMDKIRPYAHKMNDHVIALDKHYNGLLQQERDEKLQLNLRIHDLEAGLRRINKWNCLARQASADSKTQYLGRIAGLKSENHMWRKMHDMEDGWDSDEDMVLGEKEFEEEQRIREDAEKEQYAAEIASAEALKAEPPKGQEQV